MDKNYDIDARRIAKLLQDARLIQDGKCVSDDAVVVKSREGKCVMIYVRTSDRYRRLFKKSDM